MLKTFESRFLVLVRPINIGRRGVGLARGYAADWTVYATLSEEEPYGNDKIHREPRRPLN